MLTLCVCEVRIPFHFVSCKLYVNTMCEHDLTWFLNSFQTTHIYQWPCNETRRVQHGSMLVLCYTRLNARISLRTQTDANATDVSKCMPHFEDLQARQQLDVVSIDIWCSRLWSFSSHFHTQEAQSIASSHERKEVPFNNGNRLFDTK
jgi:hypothetical protein